MSGFREFSLAIFVDAARVYPKVLDLIFSRLLGTELNLLIAWLLLSFCYLDLFEGSFLTLILFWSNDDSTYKWPFSWRQTAGVTIIPLTIIPHVKPSLIKSSF